MMVFEDDAILLLYIAMYQKYYHPLTTNYTNKPSVFDGY